MISPRCLVLKAGELSNDLWFKGFCLFVLYFPIQLPNTFWLSLQNKLILLPSTDLNKYCLNTRGMNPRGKWDWKTSSCHFAAAEERESHPEQRGSGAGSAPESSPLLTAATAVLFLPARG